LDEKWDMNLDLKKKNSPNLGLVDILYSDKNTCNKPYVENNFPP
jgi:hypothetical protein